MQYNRTLAEAWRRAVDGLRGGRLDGETVILGPQAELVADHLPGPTAGSAPAVASLGTLPVPEDATATASGLPDGAFDTAIALGAWGSPAEVGAVLAEAVRVTRPGGSVWVGDVDARTLTRAMPATQPYGLLYRSEPSVAADVRHRFRATPGLGVDAVRAGLRSVSTTNADLPAAVADGVAEAVEAVRGGIWPGTELLDEATLDRLLTHLAASMRRSVRFPVVLTLPWSLVQGRRR